MASALARSSWLGRLAALLCVGLLASTGLAAPTSPAATTTDAALRQRVADQLGQDHHLDASQVVVSSTNGLVELSGSVGTQPAKRRAVGVANLVPGVRLVVNRLEWKLAKRSDAEIARDVRTALRNDAATAPMPIYVAVKKGVVTLTGAISSLAEQELAEQLAKSVPGVRFCLNNLTSRGAPQRTSAIVAADIRSRLAWDPATASAPIEVSVERGVVVLSGVVAGELQRSRAIRNAWVMGVAAVDASRLTADTEVAASVRRNLPTDADVAKAVQDAVAHYWHGRPPQVSVKVAAGVVVLSGVVDTLAESQTVEALARSAVGALDVQSQLRGPWWRPPAVRARPAPARRKRR